MMKYIIAGLMSMVVCSAVPVLAESLFKDRFGMQPDTSYYGDTVRDRDLAGDRSVEKSDDSMLSNQGVERGRVGRFPDSVNGGQSSVGNLGFGRERISGDPSVQDLSRMDGGGFAPPGSYSGSMRR